MLVLCVLAAAFASFQVDLARRLGWATDRDSPAEIAPPTGVALPALGAPPRVAAALPASQADPAKVRAALAAALADRDLGRHVLAAVAAPDGTMLFDNRSGAVLPASTLKLLGAAAALQALGPDHRFQTRVVRGARPRDVVLVGGGDPYLLAAREADHPTYADLRTLARRTATRLLATGTTRVRLGFDDSLFTGPTWDDSWPPRGTDADINYDGSVAPITALWVDQGRDGSGSGFVDDPPAQAAAVFARELAASGIKVAGTPRRAVAGAEAEPVAQVRGAPLHEVATRILEDSNNNGAELLARHVGISQGRGGSFDGGVAGVRAVLSSLGVGFRPGDVIEDGSGLSRANRLTAATLLDVLALGADPAHPELRSLLTGMPVAGFTGSLANRFTEGDADGRGRVRAKTGTLTGVHGLAGVATDLDGNVLLFAFIADRVKEEDILDARDTLDVLAAALGACRCSA